MPVVLVKRILKAEFLAEQALCPLSALGIPEDPLIHVFCFDDEDPEFRDDDMINLCGAVVGLDRDVIETDVRFFVQE